MAKFDFFEEVTDIGRNNPFGREITEAIKGQVSTWIPDKCLRNIELKADETFTETGLLKNKYLRDNYVGLDKSPRFDEFVTAIAIANMRPLSQTFGGVVVFNAGSGYSPNDELTLVGGVFTEVALLIVNSVTTLIQAGGTSGANFNGTGNNGTFTGGSGYLSSDTITMDDGTVVLVDATSSGAVSGFTIFIKSTTCHTTSGDVLTQSFTSGEGGTGFSITLGIANQGVCTASAKVVAEQIVGRYQELPLDPVDTTGTGSNAKFNINWGVRDVTVIDGGSGYFTPPAVTFNPNGGATAVATVDAGAVTAITVTFAGAGFIAVPAVVVESPC